MPSRKPRHLLAQWVWASLVPASLVLVQACVVDAAPDSALIRTDRASRATFANEAGPLLTKRCGDTTCHGNADRPFGLYAVGRRRLVATDLYKPTPLTSAEWDANYNATTGFLDADRPRESTLILKALGVGGVGGHRGGAVFAAPSDPECQAILGWIAAGVP